jgi:prepilin-type N-terminal cleavage/methylation domain-containing protein
MNTRKVQAPGYTIIEVLVTVFVLGILAALILSAVQSARESARKAQCTNNLRQLGLALSSYVFMAGSFPQSGNGKGFSPHVMLLPFLEQTQLYDAINVSESPVSITSSSCNSTVFVARIGAFLCPSRSPLASNWAWGTNYAGSRGVDRRDHVDNGVFGDPSKPPVRYQDLTDGSSTTAAMAEWVQGPGAPFERSPLGTVFDIPGDLAGPGAFSRFTANCILVNVITARPEANDKGINWILGGYRNTIYNHNLPINHHNCTNQGFVQEGAYSAGSQHNNAANVLFSDDHVQSISEGMAADTWRSLGTRNGAELIDAP